MITGNEPINAIVIDNPSTGPDINYGLTIREHFAAMAMQGMLSNDWQGYAKREEECDAMARCAVNYADALIAELNKPV